MRNRTNSTTRPGSRPTSLSLYKARLEDEDLEIAPIFNVQNLQYREKFIPELPDTEEIDRLRRIHEEEGYRKAKLEKKLMKQKRLEFFNKQYKGKYVELEERIQDFKLNGDGDDRFYTPILELYEKDQARIRELENQRQQLNELERKKDQDILTNLNYRNGMIGQRSASSAKFGAGQGTLMRRPGRLTSLVRRDKLGSEAYLRPQDDRLLKQTSFQRAGGSSIQELVAISPATNSFGPLPKLKQETVEDRKDDGRAMCSQGCGRRFAPELLERHQAICQQVFVTKRPPVDMKAKRWAKTYKR